MASRGRRNGPGSVRRRGLSPVALVAASGFAVTGASWGQTPPSPSPDEPVNVTERPGRPAPTQPPASPPEVPPEPPPPPPVRVTAQPGELPGEPGAAIEADGPRYPVSAFVIRYAQDTRGLPLVEAIGRVEVELGRVADGYVAPRPGVPVVRMRVREAADRGVEGYYASAIAAVTRAILGEFNRQGLIAVVVAPSDEDIYQPEDRTDPGWGRDLRPPGKTDLTILVKVGLVKEVRTLASGDRVPAAERVNNPAHRRIRVSSPIRPVEGEDASVGRPDLIRKDLLDDYLFRLNRHPGRHVNASLAPSEEPGGVVLDYLVSENRPWTVYAQVSNTGTEQTNEWRERFGFLHTQLTGEDDILSVDYITAGFQESHAVVASYERPFFSSDRLRWRVYGSWDQYTASDVGQQGQRFRGDDWQAGAEMTYNVFQRGEVFLDLLGGVRYMQVRVSNDLVQVEGENNFFLPYFGGRLERNTEAMSSAASVKFEYQVPQVAGTDRSQLDNLGRFATDAQWVTLRWDLTHSMYLEPVLFPGAFNDPSSGAATLAHEVALMFRGQYAFEYRLIPNEEQVVGGMYTVRGYPESAVAGDTALIASAEYRFHLPRVFGVQPDPTQTPLFGRPFRWAPQQPYGRADWDLIFKGFIDAGQTYVSDPLPFERDRTLLGAGLGVELQVQRNLAVRLDWGVALHDVPGEADQGDNRLHFSATILY